MNNNNLSTITNQQTITSMEIAQLTGKNHSDVLRAIRKMEPAWEIEHKSKFALKQRLIATGCGAHKKIPYFELNRSECLFVATKFNDQARAKLVLRWEQLEKERLQGLQPQPSDVIHQTSNLPADPSQLTRKQILLMALKAEEENERLRIEKQELEDERALMQDDIRQLEAENLGLVMEASRKDDQIADLEQRTSYLNVIMADKGTVTISQIAQDYGQTAVSFNQLLKGLHIQRKIGEQWILYAEHLDKGYVATRMIPIHHAGGPDTYKPTTNWTQAGRQFLYQKLKKHGILPLVERMQTTG